MACILFTELLQAINSIMIFAGFESIISQLFGNIAMLLILQQQKKL